MKKLSAALLLLIAISAQAADFAISDTTGTRNFTLTQQINGVKFYKALFTHKTGPGQSTDTYAVDCAKKEVLMQKGPTTGGVTGIEIPGTDRLMLLINRSDSEPILKNACK